MRRRSLQRAFHFHAAANVHVCLSLKEGHKPVHAELTETQPDTPHPSLSTPLMPGLALKAFFFMAVAIKAVVFSGSFGST